MKLPRNIPHLRSVKFAPFALISLFLFTNLTGVFFSRALAPAVNASPVVAALEMIPIPIWTGSFFAQGSVRVLTLVLFMQSFGRNPSTTAARILVRVLRDSCS